MKEILQWFRRVALFLCGIVLIVWGYQVNASNGDKKKAEKDIEPSQPLKTDSIKKIEQENKPATEASADSLPKQPEKVATSQTKKKPVKKTEDEVKQTPTKTEIESDTKAEESSGTQ